VRDKASALAREAGREAIRRGRDLRQRTLGAVYEASTRAAGEVVPDEVLVERVRAQLGRPVSHARMLEVSSEQGIVTLSGPILRGEVKDLLDRVLRIRGVQGIRDQLQVVESEEQIQAGINR
jgi:osmotically-inducible protein OsmY